MIPRFACLLLLLCGSLPAAEEPEKPDPDRFGQPLIRAWFPAILSAQWQDFRWQIHKEMQGDEYQEPEGLFSAVESSQLDPALREGVLVYYDPQGIDRRERPESQRSDEWYDASHSSYFPGYPHCKPVRFVKVGSPEEFEQEVRRRVSPSADDKLDRTEEGFVLTKDGEQFIFSDSSEASINLWLSLRSRYWTYRDGYMFFGDFEEILTMEFPNPRTLSPHGTDADRDIFVQVDLNAVLPRQKRILWELIRKEFERSLQQYDEEGDAEYAFRKSIGDLQLNLIQAVTQDLESIQLGIDFASEEKPAKAELELLARPRVNLEHYFGTSGIGTPSLAAFVEQPAAMTLATSWGLPDRIGQTLEKLQLVVDAKLAEQRGWTVDAILASEEMAEDLLETIRGNNQIAVKLKQSEHGFTLYGGMRVQNAERVSKNLALVLQGLTARDGWGVVQSRDKSGRTYFSFRPEDLTQSVTNHQRKRFPAELHFTVVDEILWFSVGREDALDILSAALDRIKESEDQPVRRSIPLALFDMSLDGMFPDKDLNDTAGFDRLPLTMVEQLDSLIPRKASPHQSFVTLQGTSNVWNLNTIGPRRRFDHLDEKEMAAEEARQQKILKQFEKLSPQIDRTEPTPSQFNRNIGSKPDSSPSNSRFTPIRQTAPKVEDSDDLNFTILMSPTAEYEGPVDVSIKPQAPDPMQMQTFLQSHQSRIRIQFDADEKRVRARATVGLGVIKHIYSRMMETQNMVLPRLFIDTSDALLDSGTIELNYTSPQLPDEP